MSNLLILHIMWIILLYILPVILGILTIRRVNKWSYENEEEQMPGYLAIIALLFILCPIINIVALLISWYSLLKEAADEDLDFIRIKWLNKLFGIKD